MKLSEYIKQRIEASEEDLIHFDVGIYPDMTVDDESPNRVRFTVKKLKSEQP